MLDICRFCNPEVKDMCPERGCAYSISDTLNLQFESYAEVELHGSTVPETKRLNPPKIPQGKVDKTFSGKRWNKNNPVSG